MRVLVGPAAPASESSVAFGDERVCGVVDRQVSAKLDDIRR